MFVVDLARFDCGICLFVGLLCMLVGFVAFVVLIVIFYVVLCLLLLWIRWGLVVLV